MKQIMVMLLVVLAGCSTAPVADLLDRFKPGELPPGPYRGGVCGNPQPAVPVTAFAPATPDGMATPAAVPPVGVGTPATAVSESATPAVASTPVVNTQGVAPVPDGSTVAGTTSWRRP